MDRTVHVHGVQLGRRRLTALARQPQQISPRCNSLRLAVSIADQGERLYGGSAVQLGRVEHSTQRRDFRPEVANDVAAFCLPDRVGHGRCPHC
jgi:hypothetical protein